MRMPKRTTKRVRKKADRGKRRESLVILRAQGKSASHQQKKSWTNNIKQTIKIDQAHVKENQKELLEINNNNNNRK